jgi:hypothetical protein
MRIYLFNEVNAEKVEGVKLEMDWFGAPLIYYTSHNGFNFALFGSHRLTAAHAKGIRPFFAYVPYIEEKHADMCLIEFADYWRIMDANMRDSNSVFPICPPMKDLVNHELHFFNDTYRPFLDFND